MNQKREATANPDDKEIGRRCAVHFELGPCFFRGKEKVKSGGGYFLGKVVERRGKNKLTVRFDDSQEADYVHKEVLYIEPSSKNPNQLVLCDDPVKCVATLQPANLVPGDIVQANYDGSNWFRGRVAFVDTSNGTCDVAYDDGEYQRGVDIRKQVILISKGAENPTWLAGLPVCFPNTSGQAKKGKIADTVEKRARIVVIYEDKKTKAFSYFSIASAIFLNVRMQPDRTILSWPAPRTVVTSPFSKSKDKPKVLSSVSPSRRKDKPRVLSSFPPNNQKKDDKDEASKTKAKPATKLSPVEVESTRLSRNSSTSKTTQPGGRFSRVSLKNVSYAEYDSDVGVDDSDLIEYNPPKAARKTAKVKVESDSEDEVELIEMLAVNRKKRSTRQATKVHVESDSEADMDVDAQISKSAKRSDANKKRKAPPRSSAELEINTSEETKKRKAPSDSHLTRKRASRSYCEEDLDGSDCDGEADDRKGRSLHGSSSRSSSCKDASQKASVEDKSEIETKPISKMRRKRIPAVKLGPFREPTYFDIATTVVEMGESESEVYISSLDSSDSFIGKCFLTLTFMFHKRVPSGYHCKRLVDLLTFGPGNMLRNSYPDHNRMENAMKVFRLLIVQHGLADHISTGLASDYVEKVINQASAPYYTIAGDERRCSSAALQRLGLTLHARACGMEVFEVLLKHQLRGCLGVAHQDDQYRSRPLVLQIVNYTPRGTKGVLKQMAKEYVHFWCQYSHFLNGCFCCPSGESNPDLLEESFDFVRTQASRVAISLGRALSYICCLYGAEASESMGTVGYALGNILKEELESNKFETNDMVSDQTLNISLQGKIAMIVHLDVTIIPDVLSKLAETLDVVDSFNTIYALLAN